LESYSISGKIIFDVQGSKTLFLNPTIACVMGGRNKLVASKAYDFLNAELFSTGLAINTPKTIYDVGKLLFLTIEKPLVPL
jgi:hypothetical protein